MEEKLLPTKKRPRKEEGNNVSSSYDEYVQDFLAYDTDQLAAAGRHNIEVINSIENFCNKLKVSLATVKQARDEEEKARKDKERAVQDEIDRLARVEKTNARKQLVTARRCFQCKAIDGGLNTCIEYKHGDGVSGDGLLLCDTCSDKVHIHSCPSCNSFFHGDLGENSCSSVNCQDDSYACKSCKEIWCLPCVENDETIGRSCDCGDWYCIICADDSIQSNHCCVCDKEELCCEECITYEKMEKCEGKCEKPLCDECVTSLACGNDVRLCGQCDYDCADCDICAGYYSSRWR